MPRAKPKQLLMYPVPWVRAVRLSVERPGEAIPVERQLSEKGMTNVRAKLIAMRNGLKQFEPRGTPLQAAAESQRLVFNKVRGDGDFDWMLTVTYTGHIPKPSEQFEANWEAWKKGLRSTPF